MNNCDSPLCKNEKFEKFEGKDIIKLEVQGIVASLDYIKNLQAYPYMEYTIKYAITNLVVKPEYNELLLSWCKESLINQKKSKNINQNPDSSDVPNRMEIIEDVAASLAYIKELQRYPGDANSTICNLADKPEFYELLLSWCKDYLNDQKKSKNIIQIPYGRVIPNRMEVIEGIAASFDCIKNLQGYPGTSKVIKYAIANLVFKPEFNELLLSWWNESLNNQNKLLNINQNPNGRVIPNRKKVLEEIVASLDMIKNLQSYPEKFIKLVFNDLVVKPEFYELISTWCKESLNNQNKSENINPYSDRRNIPNKVEVLEGIVAAFDCIKDLQGYPGTEKSVRYAIANLVLKSDFNELFSLWCKDSLNNQKKSKNICQLPGGIVILNRMIVLAGIAATLDCIKNLQVYAGTEKMIKFAIDNLVVKPEFNELLSSWCMSFWCWCDGNQYDETDKSHHRHMIAVARNKCLREKVWNRMETLEKGFKSKKMFKIKNRYHLANTIQYVSRSRGNCNRELNTSCHFYIATELPSSFPLIASLIAVIPTLSHFNTTLKRNKLK